MFLTIPNYPNYLLDTENWLVFSIKRNRYIGSHKKNDDHISIELCCDGKVKSIGLHCLIYQICVGEIPVGYCVHHIDNNPLNNNPNNLTVISREEHMSLHHKGKVVSESTREKLSKTHKGRPSTFKGKHHSEESRRKLSESNRGKPHPHKGKKKNTYRITSTSSSVRPTHL